jgi:phosphoenolpyruvate synthase/pyruvate phosphate dikinase
VKKLSLHVFRTRPKQVVALFPSSYCNGRATTDAALKEYGAKLSAYYAVFTETEMIAINATAEDHERIGTNVMQRVLKDRRYLPNLIAWSEKWKNRLRDYLLRNLNAKTIRTLSGKQIAKHYHMYVELYQEFHLINCPPWYIGGDIVERAVRAWLEKKSTNLDNDLAILTAPLDYEAETAEEERKLLDLAIRLAKKGIRHLKTTKDLPEEIQKTFLKHVDEFCSIPFGYKSGVVWDELHFLEKLNELLPHADTTKQAKEQEQRERKEQQDALMKKLNPPKDMKALIVALRQMSYLQDLKKTVQTRSHPLLQLVVNAEIARRLNIPRDMLNYLHCSEIEQYLVQGKMPLAAYKDAQERMKYGILIIQRNKYTWLTGNKAREFTRVNGLDMAVQDVKELKGTAAFKGKTTGTVKVCRTSPEAAKVKDGDILVTAMTTPDFVPAMKRAAAIVTDEGGITCHAAIVSREMKKPCIIGTKIATKVLKDGDVVEVDATTGMVKILKRVAAK